MKSEHMITIDETTYKWVHDSCGCFGHCYTDEFYADGEFYGKSDNPELCRFISRLIQRDANIGQHKPQLGHDSHPRPDYYICCSCGWNKNDTEEKEWTDHFKESI